MIFRPVRFRPLFGHILTVVATALGAVALGSLVIGGDGADLLRFGPVTALFVLACWAMFWMPELRIDEHAVTVRNILRTHHIPWSAIERIDTKFALTLDTAQRRIPVWVAPAPSRAVVVSATRGDTRHLPESARAAEGSVRPGDLPTTESGAAAQAIRRHWEQLRDDGVFDQMPVPHRIRSTWNLPWAVALGALTVASIVTLAL